jgi:hypothetical protein
VGELRTALEAGARASRAWPANGDRAQDAEVYQAMADALAPAPDGDVAAAHEVAERCRRWLDGVPIRERTGRPIYVNDVTLAEVARALVTLSDAG